MNNQQARVRLLQSHVMTRDQRARRAVHVPEGFSGSVVQIRSLRTGDKIHLGFGTAIIVGASNRGHPRYKAEDGHESVLLNPSRYIFKINKGA